MYRKKTSNQELCTHRMHLSDIADLALFVSVVKAGCIAECARNLGFERTTVSRRISRLEKSLGATLLSRANKRVYVTPVGQRCLEHCCKMLAAANNARNSIQPQSTSSAQDHIVVGAQVSLFGAILGPTLRKFEHSNDQIRITRKLIAAWDENSARSVDIGLATSHPGLPGDWYQDVANVDQVLVASPDYARRCNDLAEPSQLVRFKQIVSSDEPEATVWSFNIRGKNLRIGLGDSVVRVPTLIDAREAVVAGLGISILPKSMCHEYLDADRLVEIIPKFSAVPRKLVLICAEPGEPGFGVTRLWRHLEYSLNTAQPAG